MTRRQKVIELSCEVSSLRNALDTQLGINTSQKSTIDFLSRENARVNELLATCKDELKLAINGIDDPCEFCLYYPGNNSVECQHECSRFERDGFEWRGKRVNK